MPFDVSLPTETQGHLKTSGDSRDYTKEPLYIMDILELVAFKEKMDRLNSVHGQVIWLTPKY